VLASKSKERLLFTPGFRQVYQRHTAAGKPFKRFSFEIEFRDTCLKPGVHEKTRLHSPPCVLFKTKETANATENVTLVLFQAGLPRLFAQIFAHGIQTNFAARQHL